MGVLGLRRPVLRSSQVVWGAAAISFAARLPLFDLPAWPDEAGLLIVGSGWGLGLGADGRSLYGDHWVDRPPLLVTIYGLAERLGGLAALRLLGAVAATVTVVGVAHVARLIAGGRAAAWAAVTMAALVSTPLHWSFMVDAELLGAPFVAVGLALLTQGIGETGRRGLLLTGAGGAVACAAVVTKQNLLDVVVYAGCLAVLGLLFRAMPPRRIVRHALWFLAGMAVVAAAIGVWTVVRGTSLDEVAYAMYPFRIDAAVAQSRTGSPISWERLEHLGVAACLSGLALLAVVVVTGSLRVRRRDVRVPALVAMLAFDLFSVVAGTSYWLHYLIQPAVPVAVLTGIVAARWAVVRLVSVLAVAAALVSWVLLVRAPAQTAEELVGEAIGEASEPGDTIVTVPGHANVTYASRLGSPYEHLWALPARTLDPGRRQLQNLLNAPRAPTWVVSWRVDNNPVMPGPAGFAVADRYRFSTRICGVWIYVHRDVQRPRPVPQPRPGTTPGSRCQSVTVLPPPLRQLLSAGG